MGASDREGEPKPQAAAALPPLTSKDATWHAVYGAFLALQVRDHFAAGKHPNGEDFQRWADEAGAVADWDQQIRQGHK